MRGADSCPNAVTIDEEELLDALQAYFTELLKSKKKVVQYVVHEFERVYQAKNKNLNCEKELNAKLDKLRKTRQKYMDMYADDLISREELNEKLGGTRQEIERMERELQLVSANVTRSDQLEASLNETFQTVESVADVRQMTNAQLKRMIRKIEVDQEGNVNIYLRVLGDLGLDETVLINDNHT